MNLTILRITQRLCGQDAHFIRRPIFVTGQYGHGHGLETGLLDLQEVPSSEGFLMIN